MAGGRPSKLTKARSDRICGLAALGCFREQAARAAGVSEATLYRWIARGEREASGIYHEFVEGLRRAEATAEVEAVGTLRSAMAEGDWRAALAYLERKHPERWRRRQTNEIVGPAGGPLQAEQVLRIEPSRLSDSELELIGDLWERAVAEEVEELT